MKNKIALFLIFCLTLFTTTFAQKQKMDEDEKTEKRDARTNRIKDKTDIGVFHRQMLSLKEYNAERSKIPSLQKANKMPVKVTAVVDTTMDMDDEAGNKTLIGYIKQDIGDNSTNVYEVTFDRTQKKIVNVKYTGEGNDVEKEEKATTKKGIPATKAAPHKKKGDDDDDDDTEDEKPSKKEKDDDKD